jgi:hypothetical protein
VVNRNRKIEIELHWLEALALDNHLAEGAEGQTIEEYVHGLIQDRIEQFMSPSTSGPPRYKPVVASPGQKEPMKGAREDQRQVTREPKIECDPYPALGSLDDTALKFKVSGGIVAKDGFRMDRKAPLGGLTNRVYPCLWVLQVLAEKTASKPISVSELERGLSGLAWLKTKQLSDLQLHIEGSLGRRLPRGKKLTALFPSARYLADGAPDVKKQNSLTNFISNAFGAVRMTQDGVGGVGPLMMWDVVGPVGDAEGVDPLIALTKQGHDLLRSMEGLTVDYPHKKPFTLAFLQHLKRYAPGDFQWMLTTMDLVSDRPDRAEFQERFLSRGLDEPAYESARKIDWVFLRNGVRVKQVSSGRGNKRRFVELAPGEQPAPSTTCISIADGYIARARELGLVEPNLIGGRYSLTSQGSDLRHFL